MNEQQLIDLSHTITDQTISYKGLPAPIICDYLSREDSKGTYADDTTFQIGKIEMVGNTGTYIDCPFHRYEDGKDMAQMPLERFVDIPAVLIEAPHQSGLAIDATFFQQINVRHKAVLIHTGWSQHWNTDLYYENHPFLTEDAAQYLFEQQALLVGIDSHNIDDTRRNARPVHSILLKNEILIVEHLTQLHQLKDQPFTFSAVPPKIEGMGTFPVRAFAKQLRS